MDDSQSIFGKVASAPPQKVKNSSVRTREFLTATEINKLLKASKTGRDGIRNYCLLLLIYRHGLRCCEAISLRWSQIDFKGGYIFVKRAKGSDDSTQPIYADEIAALRAVQRLKVESPYIFVSERGAPLSDRSVRGIVANAGKLAGLDFPVHTHMLRHSCGHYLADQGTDSRHIQQYLGHKQYRHTIRYTALSPKPFENLWKR